LTIWFAWLPATKAAQACPVLWLAIAARTHSSMTRSASSKPFCCEPGRVGLILARRRFQVGSAIRTRRIGKFHYTGCPETLTPPPPARAASDLGCWGVGGVDHTRRWHARPLTSVHRQVQHPHPGACLYESHPTASPQVVVVFVARHKFFFVSAAAVTNDTLQSSCLARYAPSGGGRKSDPTPRLVVAQILPGIRRMGGRACRPSPGRLSVVGLVVYHRGMADRGRSGNFILARHGHHVHQPVRPSAPPPFHGRQSTGFDEELAERGWASWWVGARALSRRGQDPTLQCAAISHGWCEGHA